MESFITDPNQADILKTGDRCFDGKLYNAAELLYIKAGNNQKLAQVYVMLQKYALALEAARKSNIPKVLESSLLLLRQSWRVQIRLHLRS